MDKEILNSYQIGNFVSYKGDIIQINSELLGKHLLNQLDEPFKQIEIKETWLYRFGFRKLDNFMFSILNRTIYVSKLNLKDSEFWFLGSPKLPQLAYEIKYIHEIQNGVAHLDQTSIGISIDTEIEILGAKLFNLSPTEQHIEILKKQIELCDDSYGADDARFQAEQIELLSILEGLKSKKLMKK